MHWYDFLLLCDVFAGTRLICVGLRLQRQQLWRHPAGAVEHVVNGRWPPWTTSCRSRRRSKNTIGGRGSAYRAGTICTFYLNLRRSEHYKTQHSNCCF